MRALTHITKVLITLSRSFVLPTLFVTIVTAAPAWSQAAIPPPTHLPGPAETLYLQLSSVELDPAQVFRIRDVSLDRSAIHISFEDGTIAFTKDVLGRITGAFFEGDGEVLLTPPNDIERRSMSLFTGMAILEERFSTAYFRFNDNTAAELQPGLRAAEQTAEFVSRWNPTARNLAHPDAMRLLASFTDLLPLAGETVSTANRAFDPKDRTLHARVEGRKLGVFDIIFDSTAQEQVEAGQGKTAENGDLYYDVWTSFTVATATSRNVPEKEIPERDIPEKDIPEKDIPETLPQPAESGRESIRASNYVIDARIKPPKELDAEVKLQLEAVRGGSRFMVFELSRFLHLQSVEADGQPVEFIQNPAIEGSRLARSGNDLVAVILPRPTQPGQKINLRFVYGGEVLAEAGKGLLYVGARGTWYPNRGLAMSDFDLTFHYPPGWTLLATGKSSPLSTASSPETASAGGEQVTRWISERPIPVAGFNLGKYIRGAAQADNISVETYATSGVERDFPSPPAPALQMDPQPTSPRAPAVVLTPAPPSPARNAAAVAQTAAQAIRYFAARFGPFPYGQLMLTQLPGRESQGWPGLIFLSSYAFLTREERDQLHIPPANALIAQSVPAHEAAHQWWGDLVTWATYRDQWISEGLANYCALMMLQENNPAGFRMVLEKYRHDLANKNKDGNLPKDAGPVTLGARLFSSYSPEGYEAISYGRGMWLFYMLRSMLADASGIDRKGTDADPLDPFVRSLRKVRDRYQGKAISTEQLFEIFAEDLPPALRFEGKASLDWFVRSWVNGTSLPRLELKNIKFTPKANGMIATGFIRQKDGPEDLVTSVPIYAAVSGKPPIFLGRVFADGPETPFRLSAPAGSGKLLLDPFGTILTSPK